MDIATVPSNVAIVKAAISIGAALGVAVVAEGVETEAQIEMLKAWGCRYVQGFYFAPPLSPEAVGELMRGTHILPWSAGRPA